MRVPKRRGEAMRRLRHQMDDHLTQKKIDQMKKTLQRLIEHDRPETAAEVQRTREMGDLSENAAYQEAKYRLRRINSRILAIQERLKTAIVIDESSHDGTIHIGSTVTLSVDDNELTFQIVGSSETNPAKGRISHTSPIGSALLGKKVGDVVDVRGINYHILSLN